MLCSLLPKKVKNENREVKKYLRVKKQSYEGNFLTSTDFTWYLGRGSFWIWSELWSGLAAGLVYDDWRIRRNWEKIENGGLIDSVVEKPQELLTSKRT